MLKSVNLKLNPRKCCFGAQEIVFLGHVVNEQGSRPYPTKVCVISNFLILSSITNVWAFLGSLDIIEHLSMCMLKVLVPYLIP